MCGSPKPPPAPPDYSKQKAAFQSQQQQTYNQQAERYNAAASAFNNNIASFGQKVGQGSAQFGNLTIADKDKIDEAYNFWSGLKTQAANPWEFSYGGGSGSTPNSISPSPSAPPIASLGTPGGGGNGGWGGVMGDKKANESIDLSQFDLSGLNNLNNASGTTQSGPQSITFSGLTGFNLQAPNFQSVVSTPYDGQTVNLNIPNLVQPDTQAAQNYLQQVENALANLNALRQRRTEEQNRVSAFQTNYRGQLGDLESRLGNISIADQNAINSLEAELNRLENQRRGFTSALSGEYQDFFGYQSPEQDYLDVLNGISGLRTQRQEEQARIDEFRNQKLSLFDEARNNLSGLTIADIDAIRALDTNIDDAARNVRRFSSVLNPDLTRELDAYNEVNSMVDRLLSQRQQEESRIGNYEMQLLQRARALESQAQRLGIADERQAQSLMAEADQLRREAQGFSSSIGFDLSQELAPLDALQARIAQLGQERGSEQGRIGEYRNTLMDRLSDISSRASQLSIADLDQIKALDQELDALDRESRRFSAEIPFDFSDLYEDYNDLDRQLASLYNERSSEEQRVRAATQTAADRANDILRSATLSDFYDASRLDALDLDIQSARQAASGFSSVLGADFAPALDRLSQAEARLAELRGLRTEELGALSGRAGDIRSALEGAADYDENAFRQQRSMAQQILNDLALFRGQDVGDARRSFADILSLADERTSNLAGRRNELETRARELRAELRNSAFYSPEELQQKRAELEAFENEINQYRATQAEDELADIFRIFESEDGRLKSDAQTREQVAAREREDASRMLNRNNMERFFNQLRTNPTTPTDYTELLALLGRGGPSAFSRSVMQAV